MSQVLIVDDEPLARRRLELLLAEARGDGLDVDTADGVKSALKKMAERPADILLLDVRMRDGTGFDVLRAMPDGAAPAVIFVTAFGDFAVRAFDVAAADYLVKPVGIERLQTALERAEQALSMRDMESRRAQLDLLTAEAPARMNGNGAARFETEFWIRRAGGDFVRLDVAMIEYAIVEEDYVRIFAAGKSYLLRESIRGLLARLDPEEFVQVHRSALVRTSELIQVSRARFGRAEVVLRGGTRLPLGRIHGKSVQQRVRHLH